MITVQGKHNTAVCYALTLEETSKKQIETVCDQAVFAQSRIRIMPDVHAGRGCTIGTTMTVADRVVPGMVGVDIGCGMETVRIKEREVDLRRLDALIHQEIPFGRDVRKVPLEAAESIDLSALRCGAHVGLIRAKKSIGTLGGGNHFIELARGRDGDLFLTVHSGSRRLGRQTAEYYQDEGRRAMWGGARHQIEETVARLKEEGRHKEIEPTLKQLKKEHPIDIPKDLTYVEGALFDDYLHDMRIVQAFAALNRRTMTDIILGGMGWTEVERFTTVHNYIDLDAMILRKGAVSAKRGEKLLIPINMADGSLICIGKGNAEWNESAPHGAGRLMSRRTAFATLSMDDYRAAMAGIYSTCVTKETLDESPMAYKSAAEIEATIAPTADIVDRLKPIYNFKAAE